MVIFTGVYAVILTPFRKMSQLDESALRRHVEWLIAEGRRARHHPHRQHGRVRVLSDDERRRVVEVTLETANHRVPVLVGTAANSTAHTILYSHHAEQPAPTA